MNVRRLMQVTPGVLMVTAGFVMAEGRVAGRPAPPDLSGVWELDGFVGGFPLGFQDSRSICASQSLGRVSLPSPAPVMSGPSDERSISGEPNRPAEQVTFGGTFTAELTIKQTPTAISIDRIYGGSLGSGGFKGVYQLDGSEGVNTVGAMTSRTRSKWNGSQFLIEGRLTTSTGTSESVCAVRETFEIDGDRAMQVVGTGEVAGRSRTSRQTYFTKKTPRGIR